jgi:hypothetical protein
MVKRIITELYDFRLGIKGGIDTDYLISSKGLSVPEEIKEQFVVLGKSSSTIWLHLLGAEQNIRQVKKYNEEINEQMKRSPHYYPSYYKLVIAVSELYFHFCSSLDLLSRIFYVLFCPGPCNLKKLSEYDFGKLREDIRKSYYSDPNLGVPIQIEEINTTRVNLTHYWPPPDLKLFSGEEGVVTYWPRTIREKRGPRWYREGEDMIVIDDSDNKKKIQEYMSESKNRILVVDQVNKDFDCLKKYIRDIILQCSSNLQLWLRRNRLIIKNS